MKRIALCLIAFLMIPAALHAFGKNKINYYYYDWRILETDHFRIFITDEYTQYSNEIVLTAEELFAHHCETFQFTPEQKIKLVLYPNQIDFQQNNIASSWIGESTGGFTEFIKSRVVLPYSGNYANLRHILAHELTHAFQGFVWGKGNFALYAVRDIDIPLWLVEGGAEFNSIGLDAECDMMIREGLIDGDLPSLMDLSDLYSLSPDKYYYIYKEGQIFYYFINETYGADIFAKLNKAIADLRNFEPVLKSVFGMTFEQLNARFFDFLRKRYYPDSAQLSSFDVAAKKLIERDSSFNMNPVFIDTNRVAFISDRQIYPSIVVYSRSNHRIRRIIRGGFDEDYLEFHYGNRNHLSISDAGTLCFISRSGGDDVVHLYDLNERRDTVVNLPFRIINSPEISRDGSRVAFSALSNNQYDIYLYNTATGKITPVTQDKYFDNQPRFYGTNRLVFVSDRKNGIASSDLDLVIWNLDTGSMEAIADSGGSDEFPVVSPDGSRIAFVRNGERSSLMVYDAQTGQFYDEFDAIGGIYSPCFTGNDTLVLSAYQNDSFNLYEYTLKLSNRLDTVAYLTNAALAGETLTSFTNYGFVEKTYKPEFTIDNIFGALMFNSSLGIALLGVLDLSDQLGDHRIRLLMDSLIEIQTNAWNYVNIDMTYFFLKYRSDFGVRLFYYSNYFYEFSFLQSFFDTEQVYDNSYGAFFYYSYPFTTFDRLELTAGIRGYDFLNPVIEAGTTNYVKSFLNKESIRAAFIHDSTLNDYTGPVDGIRFEGFVEQSFSMLSNGTTYTKIVFDYRQYFMIAPGYSFAFRGVAGKVLGPDRNKVPFLIGGFNSLRGYDLWSFSGDSMFLLNIEFRFPMIMYWMIGFPLPIRLPTLWGVLFWDFGSAWDSSQPWNLYEIQNGRQVFKDLKSGLGAGLRIVLLQGIKLMVDFTVPYEGYGIPSLNTWRTYFQIGVDF